MRAANVAIAVYLSIAGLSMAQVGKAAAPLPAATDGEARSETNSKGSELQEVLVTAQKREERLQDVPVPVTALNADTLVERNETRIEDYFATVPGLNMNAVDNGQQSLAIRGVTTGPNTNPTVGVVIDDVPYGSSTSLGNGSQLYPDIDPSDLAHIEVLRGPQGTLYGASSLGGLIKFETKDPSTDGFSGRVQVQGDHVEGGELGYGVRGMVNVPLSDTMAIRASGFSRRDPGYIDNVLSGKSDANRANVYGGRLAALWRPMDNLSVKLSALLQNTRGDGSTSVDANVDANGFWHPVYGDLRQARMPNTNGFNVDVRLFSATVTAKFNHFDFTSISGYGINKYDSILDLTGGLGSTAQFYFPTATGSTLSYFYKTSKFSQEFRLASNGNQTLEWLAGAFYTHESSPADAAILANDLTTGAPIGTVINFDYPTTLSEYALFGDLTAHFTDQFDVQFGGRESETRQEYNETDTGIATPDFYLGNPSPYVNPTQSLKNSAFTYLVTPRYRFSPDLMAYARFTSGYRVGGNNVNAIIYKVKPQFAPDKTNNYELGIKGDFFNRAFTVDASVYYIQWKHIQVEIVDPTTLTYFHVNGGTAKSQGLELSLQARPWSGLSISANGAFNDAKLTQNLPPTSTAYGVVGERLPYSSRYTGSISVDQEVPLTAQWTGFAGGSFAYVGSRQGIFSVLDFFSGLPQQRLRYPGYGQVDFRIGARDDAWSLNLFLNNATNKRGIVGGGFSSIEPGANANVVYIQPRTIGLAAARKF